MREEEKKRSSLRSSFKRLMKSIKTRKRWVYPAIYIASAAIILSAVLWFQSNGNDPEKFDYDATDITGKKHGEPALEVNRALETFSMPVTEPDSVVIQKQFYDYDGKKEDQEAALVFYNNTYHPNTGIDITMENGKSFDVIAAMSGTVTNVLEDALLGNVIEIEHDKGIVTQYQSVTDIDVKMGDKVKKGQAIAKAGKSLYNEEAGTHVHFEIRKDSTPVNPLDYFDKSLEVLQQADLTETSRDVDDSGKADNSETDSEPEADKVEKEEESDEKDNNKEDKESDDNSDEESEDDDSDDQDEEAEDKKSSDA